MGKLIMPETEVDVEYTCETCGHEGEIVVPLSWNNWYSSYSANIGSEKCETCGTELEID